MSLNPNPHLLTALFLLFTLPAGLVCAGAALYRVQFQGAFCPLRAFLPCPRCAWRVDPI